MKVSMCSVLICLISAPFAGAARAQFGLSWSHTPTMAVVSTTADDDRLPLVDGAVSFWNGTFKDIGSGFRLPAVKRVVGPIDEGFLQRLSGVTLGGGRIEAWNVPSPPADLTVYLARSEFISFAGRMTPAHTRLVGIRDDRIPPLNLPNVARNVIAHELGHAIGLPHNGDPTKLMCGRPAPCRPAAFRSDEPRMFPLTDQEKRQLLIMYPASWKARS